MRKNIHNAHNNMSSISEKLVSFSKMEIDEVLKKMGTSYRGLNEAMVNEIRDEYGSNEISYEKRESVFKRIFDAFINPFTIVLFVLAFISVFTDVL